jgi:hypothetical protein
VYILAVLRLELRTLYLEKGVILSPVCSFFFFSLNLSHSLSSVDAMNEPCPSQCSALLQAHSDVAKWPWQKPLQQWAKWIFPLFFPCVFFRKNGKLCNTMKLFYDIILVVFGSSVSNCHFLICKTEITILMWKVNVTDNHTAVWYCLVNTNNWFSLSVIAGHKIRKFWADS